MTTPKRTTRKLNGEDPVPTTLVPMLTERQKALDSDDFCMVRLQIVHKICRLHFGSYRVQTTAEGLWSKEFALNKHDAILELARHILASMPQEAA